MNRTQLARAALLAAALVAAAPSPVQAQDRRHSQLLKVLLLLKGAPQMRASAQRAEKRRASRTPAKPSKPAIARIVSPALLAARGDSGNDLPALPMTEHQATPAR